MKPFRCVAVLLGAGAWVAHLATAQSPGEAKAPADAPAVLSDAATGQAADTTAADSGSLVPGIDVLRRARMDLLIPAGGSHHGVRYPIFLEAQPDPAVTDPMTGAVLPVDQPLDGIFECEKITRLDSDHLRLEGARWVQFDQRTGMATVIVTMEQGIFDLQSEILMSTHPVRIDRAATTIVADSFLHDRRTGMSRFTGRVRMSIYQPSPDAEPSGESTAPPQVPPTGQWPPPRPAPQP